MSHFSVLCIIPRATSDEDAKALIEQNLARYDENLECEPRDVPCYCVGVAARSASFVAIPGADFDAEQAAWQAHITPYIAAQAAALAAHPMKDKPDPECDSVEDGGCAGTGTRQTTSNPDAKWDSWKVGGRWDGAIHGNDEAKRRESADGGFNFGEEHANLTKNRRSVADYLAACEAKDARLPFAIVTPDGAWSEKGSMGWWAIVTDENAEWPAQATEILKAHAEFDGVLCDLHI